MIESCTVLEEQADGTVVRDVVFKEGAGPKPRARETVRGYWPSWVRVTDFHAWRWSGQAGLGVGW